MTPTDVRKNLEAAYALVKAARKAPRYGPTAYADRINDALESLILETRRAIRMVEEAEEADRREA